VLVWLIVLALGLGYRHELTWALDQIPGYWSGEFDDPPERAMLWEALELRAQDDEDPRIDALLEQSVAIDPRGEAAYWIARRLYDEGRNEEALAAFEAYLQTNPTRVGAWHRLARIHADAGRIDEARETLERGISFFESRAEDYEPRPDPRVGYAFNEKAAEMHAGYLKASERLRGALDQFSGDLQDEAGASGSISR